MDQKLVYAFRGWIGFVAFMDLGSAVRGFIENRSFLGEHTSKHSDGLDCDDTLLPRILGVYSILKALALIHCTLFIHYKPVVSLGVCALLVTIMMYCTEVLYFHSASMTFYVIFPCVLNGVTLVGLLLLPRWLPQNSTGPEDENAELLRQATVFKRRKAKKVN